jgi:hypothetical protein
VNSLYKGVTALYVLVAALGRVIDRFGVYLAHLVYLTQDSSVTSSSQQKLKGFLASFHTIFLEHSRALKKIALLHNYYYYY